MMLPAGYNINKLPEGYVLISNFKKQLVITNFMGIMKLFYL